jgi:hypothetical protein
MVRKTRKIPKEEKEPERAHLIRGYDELGILRDTVGFYFSREEAEAMREESRELGSEYEYSIEDFERFPSVGSAVKAGRKITGNRMPRRRP